MTLKMSSSGGMYLTFFSDHPRWATRKERTIRTYEEAIRVFERQWPDPALSPGGLPPVVATLGKVDSEQDKKQGTAIISVPFTIRNAQNKEVTIEVSRQRKWDTLGPRVKRELKGLCVLVRVSVSVSRLFTAVLKCSEER